MEWKPTCYAINERYYTKEEYVYNVFEISKLRTEVERARTEEERTVYPPYEFKINKNLFNRY